MTKFSAIAGAAVATVFLVCGVYAVNTFVKNTNEEKPRVLMISSVSGEPWQRTLVGARAAAKEFGVELRTEAPASNQTAEQQSEYVRSIRAADFDGIAISAEDPASQVELINDVAKHTKLVTLGKDTEGSKRLCHIGFDQIGAGAKAAWFARCKVEHAGQIMLLTTAAPSSQSEIVRQRIVGFQEGWSRYAESAGPYSMVTVSIGADANGATKLSNPKVALIVAFDVEAAESAIAAAASQPEAERIPIIALDTSEIVLDAIEDGRVSSAVFNDAYADGYEAIQRLALYSREDEAGLPTPGFGTIPRCGEIVQKSNVADVRGRMAIRHNEAGVSAQLHLSSAEVPGGLLGR